jgi:hypothetical protein
MCLQLRRCEAQATFGCVVLNSIVLNAPSIDASQRKNSTEQDTMTKWCARNAEPG